MSNFRVQIKTILSLMPMHKVTEFLSEIGSFFKKDDAHNAMYSIMDVIKWLRMTEMSLFGMKSKCNNVYPFLQVFQTLLLYPCFMIRNPYHFSESSLGNLLGCKKDVFYRFMSDSRIDWRKLVYHLTLQLWRKIKVRSEHRENTTCLIVDDTDFPKTGRRIENIGRVHSHVQNKSILGFKALFLAITDGASQMILDFALLGEKGKKGNFGMSDRELRRRFTKERDGRDALQERLGEYTAKKTDLTIEMISRAIKKGVRFRYVLADSWFACKDIIRFIRSRHIKCDYLGMIKVGENGKTRYSFEGKDYTAPALIKLLAGRGQRKYSRKLRCYYIVADVMFADTRVRLFFVRRSKNGAWNGLMTTDVRLGFFEAYRLYSQRWSLEVLFKEAKGLLGLGKCQANNFASQIAATSMTALQYNILSLVKRFAAYETMGKLFENVCKESLELSVTERIWGALQELVIAIAELFRLTDEDIYDAMINRTEEMNHLCGIYKLKLAS